MIKILKILNLVQNPKKIYLYLLLTLLVTVFEAFSISLIYPVLESILNENDNTSFNLPLNLEFQINTFKLIVILLSIYIIKNIYFIFYYWWQQKFIWNIYSLCSKNLLNKYLSNDYSFFQNRKQSELLQNVHIETKHITSAANGLFTLFLEILISLSIISVLLYYNFFITLILLFSFLIIILLFYKFLHVRINAWGDIRIQSNKRLLQVLKEVFDGIKTIKVFNAGPIFEKMFSKHIYNFYSACYKQNAFKQYPRIFIELILVIVCLIFIFFLDLTKISYNETIPLLGLILAASLRLIPSINKIMSNYNHILFFRSSINVILNEFSGQKKFLIENFSKKLLLKNTFEIKNASFLYNDKTIFKNLNFIINKNDCIGVYGESGSGKTTLIDIIMTLNKLEKGEIFLDKILLNNKDVKKRWLSNISYVPQSIFLFNDKIKNNVSFEYDERKIDIEKVVDCLRKTKLEKFDPSYEISEGGTNLSIGEKQRLGLARALYKDPELIILDEPTSSLDKKNEEEIINFLEKFKFGKTMIIISHNLNSLKFCNRIIKVKLNQDNTRSIIEEKS
tara:strand:- start:264 stop:1955 length:1692 start_codon:yes stop_codon:yes gene_type:complete